MPCPCNPFGNGCCAPLIAFEPIGVTNALQMTLNQGVCVGADPPTGFVIQYSVNGNPQPDVAVPFTAYPIVVPLPNATVFDTVAWTVTTACASGNVSRSGTRPPNPVPTCPPGTLTLVGFDAGRGNTGDIIATVAIVPPGATTYDWRLNTNPAINTGVPTQTFSALGPGAYTVTVIINDAAGDPICRSEADITLNNVPNPPPCPVGPTLTSSTVNDNTVVSNLAGVLTTDRVQFCINGGQCSAFLTGAVAHTFQWLALAPGNYEVTVFIDRLGAASCLITDPPIVIAAPMPCAVGVGTVTLTIYDSYQGMGGDILGTSTPPPGTVVTEWHIDGGPVAFTGAAATFTFVTPGPHTIRVVYKDASNNTICFSEQVANVPDQGKGLPPANCAGVTLTATPNGTSVDMAVGGVLPPGAKYFFIAGGSTGTTVCSASNGTTATTCSCTNQIIGTNTAFVIVSLPGQPDCAVTGIPYIIDTPVCPPAVIGFSAGWLPCYSPNATLPDTFILAGHIGTPQAGATYNITVKNSGGTVIAGQAPQAVPPNTWRSGYLPNDGDTYTFTIDVTLANGDKCKTVYTTTKAGPVDFSTIPACAGGTAVLTKTTVNNVQKVTLTYAGPPLTNPHFSFIIAGATVTDPADATVTHHSGNTGNSFEFDVNFYGILPGPVHGWILVETPDPGIGCILPVSNTVTIGGIAPNCSSLGITLTPTVTPQGRVCLAGGTGPCYDAGKVTGTLSSIVGLSAIEWYVDGVLVGNEVTTVKNITTNPTNPGQGLAPGNHELLVKFTTVDGLICTQKQPFTIPGTIINQSSPICAGPTIAVTALPGPKAHFEISGAPAGAKFYTVVQGGADAANPQTFFYGLSTDTVYDMDIDEGSYCSYVWMRLPDATTDCVVIQGCGAGVGLCIGCPPATITPFEFPFGSGTYKLEIKMQNAGAVCATNITDFNVRVLNAGALVVETNLLFAGSQLYNLPAKAAPTDVYDIEVRSICAGGVETLVTTTY